MASPQIIRQLRKMRRDWDQRARENARHYVVTGQRVWTDEEFYESGEITMREDILNDLANICRGRDPKEMTVLEIGCGAGRVTRAFAGFFGAVCAVDISREMAKRARQAVRDFPHARIYRNNGKDLSAVRRHWWNRLGIGAGVQVDFAFSTMVFQHIPSREIIENYVREAHRLLRPGGLFKFQVQGAPLPGIDPGNSWVGATFTEQEAREMARRCGFEMRYHNGAGEQYFWLWYFKPENT
ncbi:MAG: methyltransferase domain-containing protein [Candidatus Sulfopaludibacter sp.]|nr:methyltransferase domain-containing protein [Candidatus Sulfopaludibacter sp.]